MDESELVEHYRESSKDWIYVPKFQYFSIEDDEILDLDSLSLSSNEDTWLCSSNKPSPSSEKSTLLFQRDISICSKFLSNDELFDVNGSPDASNTSLLPFDDCSLSLVHLPEVSDSMVESFLTKTPDPDTKLRRTLLHNALTSQHRQNSSTSTNISLEEQTAANHSKHKTETNNAFHENENALNGTFQFKKPAEKSYPLHSVENKLFTITDANTDVLLLKMQHQNRDLLVNGDCGGEGKAVPVDMDNKTFDEMDKRISAIKANRIQMRHPTMLPKHYEIGSPELNDENVNQFSKKHLPLCQSTPMLLNRYLKYNKNIEDSKNFAKWRLSSDFIREDGNEVKAEKVGHEMNISYIKRASRDNTDSPADPEEMYDESHLNTTYSMSDRNNSVSDCLHNSTFDVHVDDDQISSNSESSLSSISNKHPLSIQNVEKMAEIQEQTLRRQVHSSYYGGSSKSSEVSSSNESISAFSPLYSSNEGHINVNTGTLKSVRRTQLLKPNYTNCRPSSETMLDSRTPSIKNNLKSVGDQRPGTTGTIIKSTAANVSKETKLSNSLQSMMSLANGVNSPCRQTMSKKELNTRNLTLNLRQQNAPKLDLQEESVVLKEIKVKTEFKPAGGFRVSTSGIPNSTFTQKKDPVSVKETKGKDNEMKATADGRAPAGPSSHIPRPSSRIPMPRSSASCTRSNSSYGARK